MPLARRLLPPLALAGALGIPAALPAQWFPALGGAELRLGVVGPEQASAGFSISGDVDLGAIRISRLRTILGATYFRGDARRTAAGVPVGGSFTAAGGRAGLRLDITERRGMVPYAIAHLTAVSVSAPEVQDVGTRDLLEGVNVGAGGGVGLAVRSGSGRSTVFELRQVWVNNVSHWAAEVGFRWGPRGNPDPERDMLLLERERQRLQSERERTRRQAERARADSVATLDARRRLVVLRARLGAPPYSPRIATSGSTRVARRAGR